MALEVINVGTAPNDGTGDSIRLAFTKCNNNFAQLGSYVQTTPPSTLIGNPGDVAGMYAYDSTYFYYCFANYDGSSTIWGRVTQIGNIAVSQIVNGTSSVDVLSIDSNISVSVNGVSNVAVFTVDGMELNNLSATGNITIDGTTKLTGNANVGHMIPAANVTYDLGSPTRKFRSLYVGGSTIYIDQSTITANATSITLSSGSGASFTVSGDSLANTTGSFGQVSASGNVNAGNVISGGSITAVGNIECSGYFVGTFLGDITGNFVVPGNDTDILYNTAGNADASSDFTWNNSTKTLYVNGLTSVTGNVTGANLRTTGLITATGNITGGNILSLGIVTASGNIQGGNILTTGGISASGNVSGQYILGNGALLTGVASSYGNANVANYLPTYSGNLAGALISVSGNVTGGNILTTGLISATGNVSGQYILGNGALLSGIASSYGNANVANYLPTYSGNLAGALVSVSGNVTGGNVTTAGLITATGNVQAGNLITAGSITASGNITGSNILVSNSGQVSTNGNVIGNNLRTATLITNIGNGGDAILNGGSNGVGNIGNSSTYFNTVFATATTALYADLAECYAADDNYPPGTVLKFGGQFEVSVSDQDMDVSVAGVVSTRPAYKMNAGLQANAVVEVALIGRVPCLVQGPIRKGQMLVSAGNGHARAETNPALGSVIGKALQDHDGEQGIIEIVVGKL